MDKKNLETPAVLLDLSITEENIKKFQSAANQNNKELWPMIKTHKSSEIVAIQEKYGAKGFLCGTLDECETLMLMGVKNIMYAYPVANEPNISRVLRLAKNCNFFVRLDSLESAQKINNAAERARVLVNYTVIIDSGLHRFGIKPGDLKDFTGKSAAFKNLVLKGVSTHPGHAYGCDIAAAAKEEIMVMEESGKILKESGFNPEFISSGSTPTYFYAAESDAINKLHPGNYIFMDNMQISMGCATEKDCALTVLAAVISAPRDGEFIIDAGSKCLGLDKGAHTNSSITGFGRIINHPELLIVSLSEEVGKIKSESQTNIRIGDKIEIIPNHACSAANMTSYYIGVRNGIVEKILNADMRSNSTPKNIKLD